MKKILLFIISLTFSISIFAGAAEKWEYDIEPIPDPSQRKVLVTGHKVDQFGDAVNDSKYKTTIDPKTIANKQKMGAVGMAKLLKKANWASVGVEALQQLLEAVDWVIDPEAQSIWRYKESGNTGFACKNFGYNWKISSSVYTCPVDAFPQYNICKTNPNATNCEIVQLWSNAEHTTTLANTTLIPQFVDIEVKFTYYNTSTSTNYVRVYKNEKLENTNQQKETLTEEALADYANKTHSDYAKPDLAPKLNPKYKPEIIPNLWKPHNEWEKTNSPTVQQVKKQLDEANPTSDNTDIDPKTDPNGNPNGFSLPEFCSWATSVCDFFKWVKTDPELEEPELPEHELEKQEIKKDKVSIRARSCPADIQFDVQGLPFGIQINRGYQMQPICDTLEPLKYVFHLITVCICAFMLLRI